MHSDDRASGFATKGHIDLRKLDADPSSDAVTARPRAPVLPTDAKEYEPRTEESSSGGMWFGVVALVAVGALIAYFVVGSGSGPEAVDAQPEVEPAPEPSAEVAPVEMEPEQPEQPIEAEPVQASSTEETETQSESRSTKSAAEPKRASKAKASSVETGGAVKKARGSSGEESQPPAETKAIDTADIARRAAAVSGDESTAEKTANQNVGGAVDEALAEKPKAPKSLDELLDTATGESDEFEEKKPEPPPPSGDSPSKADVSKVMGQLMPGFRSCAGAQVGVATALVAVKSTGKVVSARVSGAPFGGTRQGQCMEDVIKRRAQFGPFKKTRFEFRYPIRIDP